MVDRDDLVELAPHYAAMLLLTFLALWFVRFTLPGLAVWQDFLVVLVVVFMYRPLVQRFGVGPSVWERSSRDGPDIGPDPDGGDGQETDADTDPNPE